MHFFYDVFDTGSREGGDSPTIDIEWKLKGLLLYFSFQEGGAKQIGFATNIPLARSRHRIFQNVQCFK